MADGILNPIEQLEAELDFDVYTKQEVDALLDEKADKSDTYTKTETDALLDDKADADAVYTKTETDTLLSAKADKSTTLAGYGITDAYTKTQTDNLLNGKADADNVYTKTEIDTKIPNSVGSATKPTYVNGGVLTECTYELNKSVPANAVFTDTTYTAGNGLNLNGTSFSAKAGTNVTVDSSGINVNGNGTVASADSGLISGGTAYTELRPTLDGTWVKNAQTTAINLQKLEGGIEYLYGLLSHQYDQLKKYINGNYYDYDTDANSKYVKTVPAGAMPYASLDSIGGKTLVLNQLCDHSVSTSTGENGVTYTNNGDGSWTLSGTASVGGSKNVNTHFQTIAGHKYYLRGCPVGGNLSTYYLALNGVFSGASSETGSGAILNCTTNNTYGFVQIKVKSGTDVTGVTFRPQVTDLTLLYGAGNEPTTVAEFQQMFPASYYPYNAGTLLSAGVTSVDSNSKNLFNYATCTHTGVATDNGGTETTNKRLWSTKIPVVPKFTYHFKTTAVAGVNDGIRLNRIVLYNKNGSFLRRATVQNALNDSYTIPADTYFIVLDFRTLNLTADLTPSMLNGNTQFELGSVATSVVPYAYTEYPIPAEVQALEGYGWSAGSVYNYVDYERKVFVQRVGKIVLDGTESWTNSGGNAPYKITSVSNKKGYGGNDLPNIINVKYQTVTYNSTWSSYDKLITADSVGDWRFRDTSVNDMTAFKQSLADNPLTVYYELTTPVEVDISAYLTDDNLISVESGGSLTFPNANGDDYRIDVPSAETYMVDLQEAI